MKQNEAITNEFAKLIPLNRLNFSYNIYMKNLAIKHYEILLPSYLYYLSTEIKKKLSYDL